MTESTTQTQPDEAWINCVGGVRFGDRNGDYLICRRCGVSLAADSPTFDLMPPHDRLDDGTNARIICGYPMEPTISTRLPRDLTRRPTTNWARGLRQMSRS